MMVVLVLITNCHVSENLKRGPVIAHKITTAQAMIKAAGRPAAFVTAVAILSKNKENSPRFLFVFFIAFYFKTSYEKLRPINFLIIENQQNPMRITLDREF